MALLGSAALAMWWDMAPEARADFEDWHSHEHFPERLGIPGFRRGSRWCSAAGGEGFFVAVRTGSLRDAVLGALSGAPERAHALVHADDAAPPQHGALPMPGCSRAAAAVWQGTR